MYNYERRIAFNERCILYGKLYSSYVAYVYNGEFVSLIGNQRVGISPPNSEIPFHPSLALKWYQNFQDWATPVGGDTWPLLKKGNLFPSWEISELEFSHQNQKILFSLRISFIWYQIIQDWPFSARRSHVAKICRMLTCTLERRKKNEKDNIRQRMWSRTKQKHRSKVAEQSRDRRPTVKQRFFDVSSNWENIEKSRWTVTRQWSEVTRPSADCQTTFFVRFKQFEILLIKVTERSRDSGRRSRDRRPTVKQRFLYVSSNLKLFWKKSLNGHTTVVGGHATVGRLSNNFFVRFKQFEIFLKKVTERSRDSGRRSRDRRPTVKQRFWTFQAIWNFFEKSHWTVTRQWSEVTRPSADYQAHICMNKREREGERDYLRYTSYGHRHVVPLAVSSAGVPVKVSFYTVVDRQGQLVYEYCKSSHWQVEFMLCAICRRTFTRQFCRVLTPGPSSLDFSRESPAKDMWCYVACVYNGELVSS